MLLTMTNPLQLMLLVDRTLPTWRTLNSPLDDLRTVRDLSESEYCNCTDSPSLSAMLTGNVIRYMVTLICPTGLDSSERTGFTPFCSLRIMSYRRCHSCKSIKLRAPSKLSKA